MTAPISIPTESNLTMNKPNLVIKMTITPRAPLSITMPATGIRSGNPYNNFPVMPCGKDDEGELIETGYLPASTIRGIMRRGAAMPQIEAHAGGVSAATAYELVVGQTAESEKERDRIDLEAIAGERETKPLVDLFGAGLGMKSRLNFLGHFMPETPIMPFPIASVRKDLDSTLGVLELLTEKDKEFSISRVELNSRRAAAEGLAAQLERKLMSKRYPLPEEEVPGVEKELAEANKLVKAVKSEIEERLGKDAMRVSTRAIFQHWAMPPNIPLSGTIMVRDYRERDMDLLMAGFDALSRLPIVGGHSARGAGGNVEFVAKMHLNGELIRTVSSGEIDCPAVVVE